MTGSQLLAFIPSPGQGVWHLGPIPIRGYALCIIAGIVAAVIVGERRWVARGGRPGLVGDVSVWAVPFGIVGARLYHLITSPQAYFGRGGHPLNAFAIWHGGLGIWGAIAGGGLGAWIALRRRGLPLAPFADAVAPGLLVAQAMGRWGNYFNQEIFGGPTKAWWGLEISPAQRPADYAQYATFQPTFLFESLWCLLGAVVLVWLDRRYRLGHGQVFFAYAAFYTFGRFWFELMRVDPANRIFGVRVNVWVAGIVCVASLAAFAWSRRHHPEREDPSVLSPTPAEPVEAGSPT